MLLITKLQIKFYLIIFLFVFSLNSFSQKEVESSGTAELELNETITIEQIKLKVIDNAKINAIENAFGSAVQQSNSLYTVNNQQNSKVEFSQLFNSISEISVNGEWIKDIEVPNASNYTKENKTFYKASVKGIVRERKSKIVRFDVKTISCPKITCSTEEFLNNQEFYIYFKAPEDGFVAVFLDALPEKTTYRLLPGKENKKQLVPVKANTEYYFFANDYANSNEIKSENAFSLTDEKVAEINKLFVLFSPGSEIGNPLLNKKAKNKTQNSIIESGYEIPDHMPSEEFQKWYQELRYRNKNLELVTKYILIKPNY
jgi:hypothetical protein